ncbi:MAG: hypothetical protein GWP62_13285 [Gammaproteobacteria bacterium]|jgi:hypothetical protein|nr:hypothetical protein [Gammaproteobacteria bacterium]
MYFVVDSDREVSPQQSALVWQRLWEMRDLAPIAAVLPAVVSSPCPLLPDEAAPAIAVPMQSQVPEDSAWIPLEVDLRNYLAGKGELRRAALDAALRTCVAEGEHRHDASNWSSRAQRHDSRLNRRLSVFVRGWGDVIARSGADPSSIEALRDVRALASCVSNTLIDASRILAERKGHCPALDVAGASALRHGSEMDLRWRRAVADNALRHRNLLTLSPWDVFPRHKPADLRYLNLLPILACANSVSYRRDVDIGHWNAREFKSFYTRISAILRRARDTSLIAKQV